MFCFRSALLGITAITDWLLWFYSRTVLVLLVITVLLVRRWRTRTNVQAEHSVMKQDWRTSPNVVHVRAGFIVPSWVSPLFHCVVMQVRNFLFNNIFYKALVGFLNSYHNQQQSNQNLEFSIQLHSRQFCSDFLFSFILQWKDLESRMN